MHRKITPSIKRLYSGFIHVTVTSFKMACSCSTIVAVLSTFVDFCPTILNFYGSCLFSTEEQDFYGRTCSICARNSFKFLRRPLFSTEEEDFYGRACSISGERSKLSKEDLLFLCGKLRFVRDPAIIQRKLSKSIIIILLRSREPSGPLFKRKPLKLE